MLPNGQWPHRRAGDTDNGYDQVQWRVHVLPGGLADPVSVTYDTRPSGEVAVRGDGHVHAPTVISGRFRGLVIDSASRQVTYVLLQEGHVFGRKVVAIPIGVVTAVNRDGFRLGITRQEVKDLPPGWHRSRG